LDVAPGSHGKDVGKLELSNECVNKLKKTRVSIQDTLLAESRKEAKEAAEEKRRAERKKAEEEKFAKMSPTEQRKWEEMNRKREQKKRTQGMIKRR